MSKKRAIIIGAGPAGLTAAYELLKKTDIVPIVYESDTIVGGISKTVDYKGNKIDIGGHRFFSKSSAVVDWWLNILPLQGSEQTPEGHAEGPDPETTDDVMLWRPRQSRILYSQKLFDYPISASLDTFKKLGPARMARILTSYLKSCVNPIREERSLEDFFINRFGRELYRTFFKDYTEKLWGVPCREISSAWGAQRIKGLSLTEAVLDIMRRFLPGRPRQTETSLIKQFMYPKLGPGQLWTEVARIVEMHGGEVHRRHSVTGLAVEANRVVRATVRNEDNGQTVDVDGDYFFSTMPIKDLVGAMSPVAPRNVRNVAQGLVYRDFLTVGLLLKDMKLPSRNRRNASHNPISDCWLYIQEPFVKMGRIQIFNNWSPYLVRDPKTIWLGLEYFCNEGQDLWNMTDDQLSRFAIDEMVTLGFISVSDVLDSTVIRMPKAYPAYFGTYDRLGDIRAFTDSIENLFLVGRNGMHKYNNSDHSMLSAIRAVDNIAQGVKGKDAIWAVNTEVEYHEVTTTSPNVNRRGTIPIRALSAKKSVDNDVSANQAASR